MKRRNIIKNKLLQTKKYRCPICDEEKIKDEYYTSYNPLYKSKIIPYCKKCIKYIAQIKDQYGNPTGEYTKESIKFALEILDKPFLNVIWNATFKEMDSNNKKYSNVLGIYMKNIQMKEYRNMRWKDSD